MGWNDEPGKENEKKKDPWNSKNQPPDLDEALKRFQERLKKTFSGKGSSDDKGGSVQGSGGSFLALLLGLVIFVLWALSGIFIVDPAEQAAVLYFGKYTETLGPGPHWIPRFFATNIVKNVDQILDYSYSGQMLTQDEKLVLVSVVVQYRIGDLENFLFSVVDPQESLKQATSSALREVLGTTTLDDIITQGREIWGERVYNNLINILTRYNTGIRIVNVSPQPARAPDVVQDAFDDAIKAKEDQKRFKQQALAYAAKVVPLAKGDAERMLQEAGGYAQQVVLKAKGEVAGFLALLPQYNAAPQVTAERMYLDTMEKVLSNSTKIIVDSKSGNLLYLPLDKLIGNGSLLAGNSPNSKPNNNLDNQDENALFDNRQLQRSFLRPERTE